MSSNPGANAISTADSSLWIVFGDLHDQIGNIKKIPQLEQAAGIIISGDLTQLGGVAEAEKVISEASRSNLPVLAQTGNMDKPEIDSWLSKKGINIHARAVEITPGVAIFGIGGSTPTPFNTPTEYPENSYAAWLDKCWQTASKYSGKILISHNPPKDTNCDKIGSGSHVGSQAVRDFIEKYQPNLCICGHIHESRGEDQIGKTIIINPGMLSAGGYAIIKIDKGKISSYLCKVDNPESRGI